MRPDATASASRTGSSPPSASRSQSNGAPDAAELPAPTPPLADESSCASRWSEGDSTACPHLELPVDHRRTLLRTESMDSVNQLPPTHPNEGEKQAAMHISEKRPTTKAPADRFTGDVWVDVIADGQPSSRVRVNVVRFAPGARNAWHAHAVGQTIHVTEGIGRVQSRGGNVVEIRPGDTIVTPPGEWHWHGSAPDHFMTHLAIWEAPDAGPESEWGDLVTDEEYGA